MPPHSAHANIVRAMAFPSQPRPQILATGGFEKRQILYDISHSSRSPRSDSSSPTSPTSNKRRHHIRARLRNRRPGAQGHYRSIIWGSNPNVLITACEDRQIRWFDIRARDFIASCLDGPIGSCELNPSGSTLSVAAGKTAYLLGPDLTQLVNVTLPTDIAAVAVHEGDRKFVTSGHQDTWVKVWDLDVAGAKEPLDIWEGASWTDLELRI